MKTCDQCGVELDASMNYCPLCGRKNNGRVRTHGAPSLPKRPQEEADIDEEALSPHDKQKILWEISTILLLSGIVSTFVIDLFVHQRLTWSRYTMTAGFFLLANVSLLVFLQKKLLVLILGCFASTSVLVLLLDLFSNDLSWGPRLGLPIVFASCLVVAALSLSIRISRQKGVNVIAYTLMAAGVLCFFIESILSFNAFGCLRFKWSIIVLISVLPVAAFLTYVHFRLKRGTSLRKVFHL